MRIIIPLAAITSLLTACVAPIPVNTNTTAIYPGYFPVYAPRIQTPVIPSLPVPIASVTAPKPKLINRTKAAIPVPIVKPPQTVPVAYNKNIARSVPVVNVPVLSPVSNTQQLRSPSKAQTRNTAKPIKTNAIPVISAPQAINNGQPKAQDLNWLAQRIFRNQSNGDMKRLVRWNERGNFAAIGIGQFIWYPAGKRGQYRETFPAYLDYVKANGVPLPTWLAQRPTRGGPWRDTAAFQHAQSDQQMQELRNFMQKTLNLQANFMALQLRQTLPQQINQLPPNQRQNALRGYQTMSKTPGGLYPMLDYLQFQGDGANPTERYNGKGWGLLQVLQNMEQVQPGPGALAEFMRAADDTLVTRIANAPADRREARLLDGWLTRVNTYRPQHRASR